MAKPYMNRIERLRQQYLNTRVDMDVYNEHIRDWNELFGARDEASQKNLAPLWETAQKVINQ